MAKLHDAMRMHGTSNFQIKPLEHIQKNDEHELQQVLNQKELYWQEQFKSVKRGWNKVNAPQPPVKKQLLTSKSLAALARENNVAYNSLRHRTNNLNETPEQAIAHLKTKRMNQQLFIAMDDRSLNRIETYQNPGTTKTA